MSFTEISRDQTPLKQLKDAIHQNPVIAERADKPNLSAEEVQSLGSLLPESGMDGIIRMKWSDNKIDASHPYYERAEDQIFEIHLRRKLAGKYRWYYLKGFFFDRDKLIGVYLISAREVDASFQLA